MWADSDPNEKQLTPYAKTVAVGAGTAVFSTNRCVRVVETFVKLAQKLLSPVLPSRCHKVSKRQINFSYREYQEDDKKTKHRENDARSCSQRRLRIS